MFRQVIIGSELQSGHSIVHAVARSQHQHAIDHMLRAQTSQHFKAIDPRQANIEHDQVKGLLAHFVQSGFTIVNGFRIMTGLDQRRSDLLRH
jgi:hypothetical protein